MAEKKHTDTLKNLESGLSALVQKFREALLTVEKASRKD